MTTVIQRISTRDACFPLQPGEGVDSIHANPTYSYAVALIETDTAHTGVGVALTLGTGNELVCQTIRILAEPLVGREIEELMSDLGKLFRSLADHPQMRWLGPHKGVVHLALAAIINGCFDLWAKTRGVPLWKILIDLTPEQIISLLDLSYLEDVLTEDDALAILRNAAPTRAERTDVLQTGYPGYDTSVGWFDYSDEQIRENARRALKSIDQLGDDQLVKIPLLVCPVAPAAKRPTLPHFDVVGDDEESAGSPECALQVARFVEVLGEGRVVVGDLVHGKVEHDHVSVVEGAPHVLLPQATRIVADGAIAVNVPIIRAINALGMRRLGVGALELAPHKVLQVILDASLSDASGIDTFLTAISAALPSVGSSEPPTM